VRHFALQSSANPTPLLKILAKDHKEYLFLLTRNGVGNIILTLTRTNRPQTKSLKKLFHR
jgi:hypothetical protein